MSEVPRVMLSACGREIGPSEIAHAQEVVGLCGGLSREQLAKTLCEHWGWFFPTGAYRVRACRKLLEKLEKQGLLKLPAKQTAKQRLGKRVDRFAAGISEADIAPQPTLENRLEAVRPIRFEQPQGKDEIRLWNAFVDRYHTLGYKQPFGCSLRYFIISEQGRLGCLLFASAAKALQGRDAWIGWSVQQRLSNLPWVINNSRFMLFPWIRVPHLASHILGQLARRVGDDWEARWGYRPVLMETFVDPKEHRGVCYRAAGWELLGETSGHGLRLRGHRRHRTTPKLIFVRPLVRDFRAQLCTPPQQPASSNC